MAHGPLVSNEEEKNVDFILAWEQIIVLPTNWKE